MARARLIDGARPDLPTGRAGQGAALGLTLAGLLVVWFGLIAPGLAWYDARARSIAERRLMIAHERALIAALPELRRRIAGLRGGDIAATALLTGGSDAVAGAALQGDVQALAARHAITLDSAEILTTVKTGTMRRIPLRISLTTDYPRLIALLGAIGAAAPRMLVDDVSLHATGLPDPGRDLPLRARFTISAFRAAQPR
ncbi:type II secretion system protein GspM [Acidiphilium sp. PA]|uniref:type II secretion system protein GspM n=1 Tax=Acidiphilium sp. PA TaxID=2871705 RepID=UPI0022438A78|nr:type II secretion system protein GspM [Acidiphilium sp. PA]MCW8305956.1 type II secretion system protein GspM [Acidiphilium sp. PA]